MTVSQGTGRTVHALDARGTVTDWLVSPVWSEPAGDLAEHLSPNAGPWGASGRASGRDDGRWVLTNGPDVTPLKQRLYAHRPLGTEPVGGEIAEGAPLDYTGPSGTALTGTWRRVHTGGDGLVDASEFCFTPVYRVMLAATVVEVDQAEWRTLNLASTGPTRLFVNGELVGSSGSVTYMEPAEHAVRLWLPSRTSTIVVASWQVAFRECRQVVRLRVGGLPVRVVIPSASADEHVSALAEQLLDGVGATRWGSTEPLVPVVGPGDVRLRVTWAGRTWPVPLRDGRATVNLDDSLTVTPEPDGEGAVGNASMLTTGAHRLRVRLDDDRAPVFRDFPVATLPRDYRPHPEGDPDTWREELLEHVRAATPSPARALARGTVTGDDLDLDLSRALWMIDNRADCADFEAVALLHLWHRVPADRWAPGARERVRDALAGFKYWIDQPGLDAMCYFTENHQLVWHTAEVLAGEAFAEATFSNSGWTGAEHAAHGRRLATEWIRQRLAGGFSEFDSNAYLAIDVLALVSLAEFAAGDPLAELAAGLADRALFGLAANSWQGVHGAAHGRSYVQTLRSSRLEETAPIMWVCFGVGALNDAVLPATVLATARRYRVPPVLREVAADTRDVWEGTQRFRGAYRFTHDLLERPYQSDAVVYKTPDVMLASVQDYRAGLPGLQEHVWGATLGPETQVFATHAPNASVSPSARPNAWAGNRVLPRARQHRDVVVAVYRIPDDDVMGYTHAWFPTTHLDEWCQDGTWTAGRRGDGYVALATAGGARFVTSGPDAWQELRPNGGGQAWVCVVGRRAVYGSLDAFVAALSAPAFTTDGVDFTAPDGRKLRLHWEGPFTVDGSPAGVDPDGRIEVPPLLSNPFTRLEGGDEELVIGTGEAAHRIDLRHGRKLAEDPPPEGGAE